MKRILIFILTLFPVFLSGQDIFKAHTGEVEVERTRNFKRFAGKVLPDGKREYRIAGQVGPIHYKSDPFSTTDDWQEIDLTILLTPEKRWVAENSTNGYKTRFWNYRTVSSKRFYYVARYERAGQWLEMAPTALWWENRAGERQIITMVKNRRLTIDNTTHRVSWESVWGEGIDFRYNLSPDEFFKTVVIRDRDALPKCTLTDTTGLVLKLSMVVSWGSDYGPVNGFAKGRDVSKFGAIGTVEESRKNITGKFAFQDSNNRNLWWFKPPAIWDNHREHLEEISWSMIRSAGAVEFVFSVPAGIFERPDWVWPLSFDTAMSEEQVGATADDACNFGAAYPGDGNFFSNSTYHYFGATTTPRFNILGTRFQTVPIPKNSLIQSATLSVYTYGAQTDNIDIYIGAQDVDDAAAYATTTHEPYDDYLAVTTAKGQWTVTDNFADNTWYTTSTVASVVQEIVDRASWAANNDICFVWYNVSTTDPPPASARLAVDTWDETGNVNGPKFNCTYHAPWGGLMNGVPNANIGAANGVLKLNIDSVNGVD